MTHLSVTVWLRDCVVDERICPLVEGLTFGDTRRAAVAFPGRTVRLTHHATGWNVAGLPLRADRPVVVHDGDVKAVFELVVRQHREIVASIAHHGRLLLATAAAILAAAFLDQVDGFVNANPELADRVQAFVFAPASPHDGNPSQTAASVDLEVPVQAVRDAERPPATWVPARDAQ